MKDALKENTEHALSPKQVSAETGVDYKVLQNVVLMMELHLCACNKYMKEKVYGHQLTAHVDKKVLLKAFQELAHKI